jgi:energy-coupling factor transporter ATP-binding protein EcfA2
LNAYLFGDQLLRSAIPLKALPRPQGAVRLSGLQIDLLPVKDPDDYPWQHEWKDADGSVSLALAAHQDGFLLRFPELCDFILDLRQRRIQAIPHTALDDNTLEHLLVDQVLPRFLAQEGHLLLHASALSVEERTILFLGKSGWGKSTLAGLLKKAHHTLYSDDCVLLKQEQLHWTALATYPSLRLYEDSIEQIFCASTLVSPVSEYSDKQRIALPAATTQKPAPVHALYFLSDPEMASDTIDIHAMTPSRTCIDIIERSFRLDLGNRQQSQHLMQQAAALAATVPAYRLSYPHDYQNNAQLIARLIQHIQA